jgi:hypothetical protein
VSYPSNKREPSLIPVQIFFYGKPVQILGCQPQLFSGGWSKPACHNTKNEQ